jgi:hypothetical protein
MSNTPEIDEVEKYSGITVKDSVTTCGDESSSVYIPVIFARQLERERNKALIDRANGEIATMTINHYERILKKRDEAWNMVEKLTEQGLRLMDDNRMLKREIKKFKKTIRKTLEENRHLADGSNCTLLKLKQLVPDWE